MLGAELTWDDVPMLIPEMASMVSYAAGEVEPTVHSFRMVTASGLAMMAHWYAVGQLADDDAFPAFEPMRPPTEEEIAVAEIFAEMERRMQSTFLFGSPDA